MLFSLLLRQLLRFNKNSQKETKKISFILGERGLNICHLYFVLNLVYISVLQKASFIGQPLSQSQQQQTSTENIKDEEKMIKKLDKHTVSVPDTNMAGKL